MGDNEKEKKKKSRRLSFSRHFMQYANRKSTQVKANININYLSFIS